MIIDDGGFINNHRYDWLDAQVEEIWNYTSPKRGDHIRVNRGLYCHHGIYVAEDEVIHFTGAEDDSVLDWSKASVIKTGLACFLKGGRVEVKEYTDAELPDLYPVEGIVSYARSCLGEGGYNLIFNNCEHFANACTLGKYRSHQVERLGRRQGETENMGWLGKIGSWLFGGSSSGSRSTSNYNYNYDPDKVKVAQIEADLKLKLADKERERIELMRDAQKELLQMQAMGQIAIEDARTKGMKVRSAQLVELQEKLLEVAQKRIQIIENGSLPIVREIEAFYNEVGDKVNIAHEEYNTEKLPKLLELLDNYEEGTPAHTLYAKQIENDMNMQNNFVTQQLSQVAARQDMVLNSFIKSKEQIIEQTGRITEKIAEGYLKVPENQQLPSGRLNELPGSGAERQVSAPEEHRLLEDKK